MSRSHWWHEIAINKIKGRYCCACDLAVYYSEDNSNLIFHEYKNNTIIYKSLDGLDREHQMDITKLKLKYLNKWNDKKIVEICHTYPLIGRKRELEVLTELIIEAMNDPLYD